MGGSPPPGSKKGGYKPVVRSCVEKNINWLKAQGKLVWKDGGYFHDEFGRTGLFSSGVGSAGDPLGHSYQYGERICDYYLGALELPKPSDPKN